MTVIELRNKLNKLIDEGQAQLEVKVSIDEFLNVVRIKNVVKVEEFKFEDANYIIIG